MADRRLAKAVRTLDAIHRRLTPATGWFDADPKDVIALERLVAKLEGLSRTIRKTHKK